MMFKHKTRRVKEEMTGGKRLEEQKSFNLLLIEVSFLLEGSV